MFLKLKRGGRKGNRKGTWADVHCSLKRMMGHIGVFRGGDYLGLHRLCSHYTPQTQSNKYAFNRRLKRDKCPLNATKRAPCSTPEEGYKGELLYRLAAHGGKRFTRTVFGRLNRAAQKFIFTLEKIPWVLGTRAPCAPMDPPLISHICCSISKRCRMTWNLDQNAKFWAFHSYKNYARGGRNEYFKFRLGPNLWYTFTAGCMLRGMGDHRGTVQKHSGIL